VNANLTIYRPQLPKVLGLSESPTHQ